jgi:hypothetical protein
MTYICYAANMRRTTIFLPEDLHEKLRRDAFRAKTSMAELIRRRLAGPASERRKARAVRDPILKVAGVFSGATLSGDIDDALYGG